jgi:CRISPR/Cas system endoribonuclease Cas6 (RAMP superfamily)
MPDIIEMTGKEVEVIANGISYKGVLIEVSETEVHIKGMLGYISLQTSAVTDVRPAEKRSCRGRAPSKFRKRKRRTLFPRRFLKKALKS